MHEDRRVRMFLQGLVMLNLVVLSGLFLGPRLLYMINHRAMTTEEFLQTAGTFDLPNLYQKSYELAFAVKEATPESAVIQLPPSDTAYLKDSVLYQVLLPRKLVFADHKVDDATSVQYFRGTWVVSRPQSRPHSCRGSKSLANTGYVICRVKN